MQTKLLWIGENSPAASSNEPTETVHGLEVVYEPSLVEGLQRLNTGEYCLVVLNVSGFEDGGEQALAGLLHHDPRFPVIAHYPEGTIDDAIRLTRHGAFYVLLGEIEPQRLEQAVKMALERCRARARVDTDVLPWRRLIVGQSRAMQHILDVIQLIASKRVTVLISGETGTGKEVIAKGIHGASNRAARAMVSVNCTALPASLIETELFGHAKGAFTGAHASRIGRFEQANRSTIFLDEIGDLPLDAQAKLLRVLQEQEFQRIGSSENVRVDVRVIAASNINLEQAVKERRFREDLYYRLNVVPIHIPPLRERREDIPPLLDHFLERIQAVEGGPAKRLSPEAVEFLTGLEWPGNVRQLEHAVHKAFALSGDRRILVPSDFSAGAAARPPAPRTASQSAVVIPPEGIDFDEVVSTFELALLNQALTASNGNKARAADLLRMKRTTLLAKMKTFDERGSTGSKPPARAESHPAALVFEPDGSVRKLIAKTLEQENYRVLEAANGSMALELFQCWKNHIHLLIGAVTSDDSSTRETTMRLRTQAPELPMIVVCDAHDPRSEDAWKNGQTLHRPFSTDELLDLLRKTTSSTPKASEAYCA